MWNLRLMKHSGHMFVVFHMSVYHKEQKIMCMFFCFDIVHSFPTSAVDMGCCSYLSGALPVCWGLTCLDQLQVSTLNQLAFPLLTCWHLRISSMELCQRLLLNECQLSSEHLVTLKQPCGHSTIKHKLLPEIQSHIKNDENWFCQR